MKNDPLKDIWRVRDQIGAECGYDLKRLRALIHREEIRVGKRLVHFTKSPSVATPSPTWRGRGVVQAGGNDSISL